MLFRSEGTAGDAHLWGLAHREPPDGKSHCLTMPQCRPQGVTSGPHPSKSQGTLSGSQRPLASEEADRQLMDGQGAPSHPLPHSATSCSSVCDHAPALMELPVSWGSVTLRFSAAAPQRKSRGCGHMKSSRRLPRKPGDSHPYMTTGKTIALTSRTFVGKVMSLPFPSPG